MLKERIITAVILLIIFIAALMVPRPEFFGALTLVFIGIGGWEWARLNGFDAPVTYLLGMVVALICGGLWLCGLVVYLPGWFWWFVGAIWVVGAPFILFAGSQGWLGIPKTFRLVLGVLILCSAWAAMWLCKLAGNNFLLSVLFMVWAADTGAYCGGKIFGKHKLAPSISPGKSWEGAISGALTVMLLAVVWVALDRCFIANGFHFSSSIFSIFYQSVGIWFMVPILLFLTAMSIVGDLSESLMKRSVGMKDSSRILPGHGGVLDRVDALLPVLPLSIAFISALS